MHPNTAFWTLVDSEGYSISSKGFLPTVVYIMVIKIKYTHSSPFYLTDFYKVGVHSYRLLLHFQFALIHELNIPGSYAILFFTALDFISIISHIHNWVLLLLWLSLFSWWLDAINYLIHMSLINLWELVIDREACVLPSIGLQRVGHDWGTELNWQPLHSFWSCLSTLLQ